MLRDTKGGEVSCKAAVTPAGKATQRNCTAVTARMDYIHAGLSVVLCVVDSAGHIWSGRMSSTGRL